MGDLYSTHSISHFGCLGIYRLLEDYDLSAIIFKLRHYQIFPPLDD
jgi:hypothetical protein